MKTKTFKNFLSDYVKDMNPEHTLSMIKIELLSKKDTRLLNLFALYVFFENDLAHRLLTKKKQFPKLYQQYHTYRDKYRGITIDNIDDKVSTLQDSDELNQLYNSYKNLVINKNLLLKKKYHEKIVNLQKEKMISNYRIYKDLNLNHGNTNDFLKNKNYKKLSLNVVRKIVKYLVSL